MFFRDQIVGKYKILSTIGSGFDTILGVYTGAALNGLTLIAANDDANGGTFQSQLTFMATQNITCHFLVDGFNDGTGAASGDIQLNLTTTP